MALKLSKKLAPEWMELEDSSELEDDSDPAGFKVRGLQESERLEVYEHIDRKTGTLSNKAFATAFQLACVEFRNISDVDGKPLKCTKFTRAQIPIEVQIEIGSRILARSEMSEAETKNS